MKEGAVDNLEIENNKIPSGTQGLRGGRISMDDHARGYTENELKNIEKQNEDTLKLMRSQQHYNHTHDDINPIQKNHSQNQHLQNQHPQNQHSQNHNHLPQQINHQHHQLKNPEQNRIHNNKQGNFQMTHQNQQNQNNTTPNNIQNYTNYPTINKQNQQQDQIYMQNGNGNGTQYTTKIGKRGRRIALKKQYSIKYTNAYQNDWKKDHNKEKEKMNETKELLDSDNTNSTPETSDTSATSSSDTPSFGTSSSDQSSESEDTEKEERKKIPTYETLQRAGRDQLIDYYQKYLNPEADKRYNSSFRREYNLSQSTFSQVINRKLSTQTVVEAIRIELWKKFGYLKTTAPLVTATSNPTTPEQREARKRRRNKKRKEKEKAYQIAAALELANLQAEYLSNGRYNNQQHQHHAYTQQYQHHNQNTRYPSYPQKLQHHPIHQNIGMQGGNPNQQQPLPMQSQQNNNNPVLIQNHQNMPQGSVLSQVPVQQQEVPYNNYQNVSVPYYVQYQVPYMNQPGVPPQYYPPQQINGIQQPQNNFTTFKAAHHQDMNPQNGTFYNNGPVAAANGHQNWSHPNTVRAQHPLPHPPAHPAHPPTHPHPHVHHLPTHPPSQLPTSQLPTSQLPTSQLPTK